MWAVTGVGRKLFENILLLGAFFLRLVFTFLIIKNFKHVRMELAS